MVQYKSIHITAKRGVNFVRSIVENSGSLFHKIETENDLGVDAIIEIIKGEKPSNYQVAVQIKSGPSYYNSNNEECLIPIENHKEYWTNHPLPVYGIVYIPNINSGYWIDIKSYLKSTPEKSVIRFKTNEINRFDNNSFSKLFIPQVLREVPDICLADAIKYFKSTKPDESYLGLITLFRRFPNSLETWDEIINAFKAKPQGEIPRTMIYYLAHIPWHGDIYHTGEMIKPETTNYAKNLIATFNKNDINKLLNFINEEEGIARGSIGQSVEAIISSHPDHNEILVNIIEDDSIVLSNRQFAGMIYAMNLGVSAIPLMKKLVDAGSWYTQELINYLIENGELNPYS